MTACRWLLTHQPFGGQVLGAQFSDSHGRANQLFHLSTRSLGPRSPVRGGVPVLFQQFNELGPLPKHGLVRTATWQSSADGYRVEIAPGTHSRWPHAARLSLLAHAEGTRLSLTLGVENIGPSAFEWTGGLHPYFAVADITRARLTGLAGCGVSDRYDPSNTREQRATVSWAEGAPCERLYAEAPELLLDSGACRLRLGSSGFDQWMVWNPGETLAESIPDLSPGDWRRFVCVEPVIVSQPNQLEPGERFTGVLTIDVLID